MKSRDERKTMLSFEFLMAVCGSWQQKVTDYSAVIFDFERDIFKRNNVRQLSLEGVTRNEKDVTQNRLLNFLPTTGSRLELWRALMMI
jgi:hypothetical protein